MGPRVGHRPPFIALLAVTGASDVLKPVLEESWLSWKDPAEKRELAWIGMPSCLRRGVGMGDVGGSGDEDQLMDRGLDCEPVKLVRVAAGGSECPGPSSRSNKRSSPVQGIAGPV